MQSASWVDLPGKVVKNAAERGRGVAANGQPRRNALRLDAFGIPRARLQRMCGFFQIRGIVPASPKRQREEEGGFQRASAWNGDVGSPSLALRVGVGSYWRFASTSKVRSISAVVL